MPINQNRRVGISQIRQGGFSVHNAAADVVVTTPALQTATKYGSKTYVTQYPQSVLYWDSGRQITNGSYIGGIGAGYNFQQSSEVGPSGYNYFSAASGQFAGHIFSLNGMGGYVGQELSFTIEAFIKPIQPWSVSVDLWMAFDIASQDTNPIGAFLGARQPLTDADTKRIVIGAHANNLSDTANPPPDAAQISYHPDDGDANALASFGSRSHIALGWDADLQQSFMHVNGTGIPIYTPWDYVSGSELVADAAPRLRVVIGTDSMLVEQIRTTAGACLYKDATITVPGPFKMKPA